MPEQSTSLASSAPKFLWPVVVVVALIVFRDPITDVVRSASRNGLNASGFGVNVSLSGDKIPPVPDLIKNDIEKLEPDMIANILGNVGGSNTSDTCYDKAPADELQPSSVKSRLKNLGLITFEPEDPANCAARTHTAYTPKYDVMRNYLLSVLSSVKFTPTKPSQ